MGHWAPGRARQTEWLAGGDDGSNWRIAGKAAFRYARAIEALCFEGLCLGVNIGLAAFPEDGKTPDELLSAADSRMYQAKARGLAVLA